MKHLVLFASILALFAATACKSPRTQIMVTTDTNLAIPGQLDAIAIEVTGPSGQMATADADLAALPAFLGVLHESGALGPVIVRVVGRRGGANVIERRAELDFQPERTIVLSMNLLASCLTTACSAGQTCGESGCRSVTVDGAALADWSGTPPGIDGGGPVDTGTDTAVDTAVDTCVRSLEVCNGVDDDCDMMVDEGLSGAPELCNGMDDDCDMMVDEDFDLVSDLMNCGSCGNVCALPNATPVCTMGVCEVESCDGTFLDCDMDPATGCEADPAADDANCGSCGMACSTGATCDTATCTCTPPLEMGATACVDVSRDPLNCGTVGTVCMNSQLCAMDACACRPGLTDDGAGGCVDLFTDPMNCGTVGNACGGDVCRDGMCRPSCGPREQCGSSCTDTNADVFNCGSCGVACTTGQVCAAGDCRDYVIGLECATCPCPACPAGDNCCEYPAAGDVVCVAGPCP